MAATVLVASDNPAVQAIAKATLGRAYRLIQARDGVETLALARAEQPNLVLVHSDLPQVDGWTVCQQLKAHSQTRTIATLLFMDRSAPAGEQRALEAGADGCLFQPLSPVGLLTAVERALTRGRESSTAERDTPAEEPQEAPPELAQTLSYARELGFLYGEWKAQIATIEHQSLHDGLTDLPNRMLLRRRLEEAVQGRALDGQPLALLVMDLDHFKEVNDTLGHQNGDRLLQEVAMRLTRLEGGEQTTARMGGDEFAVLLPTADAAGASAAAQQILGALREPFILDGVPVEVEASIGIALYPDHGADADALLRRADVAMYLAKGAKSGYCIYTPEQDPHSPSRLALAAELRRALESEELLLHYQPRVNCRTGRVDAVEALVRWNHPQYGLLKPDQFVPLAERTGLVRPLTLWVLGTALRQCRIWRKARTNLAIAVNLSARNLHDPGLGQQIAGLLATWQVEPVWLKLEVTESAIMADDLRVKETVSSLRNIGVQFAVDDFGTGYSSLAHLKELPVDEIKIDKSFVVNMASDAKDAAIVRSSIDLGHNLGLQVVAEGVESRDIWNLVITLGCDAGQGNYLSPPIPAEQLPRARAGSLANLR